MRKYILSIFFLALGASLLIYGLYNRNKTTFSEKVFEQELLAFEAEFDALIERTENRLVQVMEQFPGDIDPADSSDTRAFYLDFLSENPDLTSAAFIQGAYTIVAQKEDNSLVFAVDSLDSKGVVRWQRYEKGELVSSWFQSFDGTLAKTPWFKEIARMDQQMRWFIRTTDFESVKQRDPSDYIYCGYAYVADGRKSVILLEYSKNIMRKNLGFFKPETKSYLRITTEDRRELFLDSISEVQSHNDSLNRSLNSHFRKFDTIEKGKFNFNFGGTSYWAAFNHYPKDSGLDNYLLSIDSQSLGTLGQNMSGNLFLGVGVASMLLGFILLAIRKRFFYRPNRMSIPSLDELLSSDENRYLEFKSSLRWDYRQEKPNPALEQVILKTIAAFGNTDGGILLIGVDDDKNILGLENDFQTFKKKDADYFEIHLRNILHKEMGVKYVSKHIRTEFETLSSGLVVCKIRVLSADEPVFLRFKNKSGQTEEKFYVRSGNSSHEIKSLAEINDYLNEKYKK